jgi:hypothetical protein
MKEWSDDELDKLFRKSSEELDPQFEPGDWSDLRRRLDAADRVPGARWLRSNWPWIALMLLIGGLGVYLLTQDMLPKATETESQKIAPQGGTQPSPLQPDTTLKVTGEASADIYSGQSSVHTERNTSASETIRSSDADRHKKSVAMKETRKLPRNLASVSGVREQTNLADKDRGDGAVSFLENKRANLPGNPTEPGPDGRENRPPALRGGAPALPPGTSQQQEKIPAGEADLIHRPSSAEKAGQEKEYPQIELLTPRNIRLPQMEWAYPAVSANKETERTASSGQPEESLPKWSIRLGVSPDLSGVNLKTFAQPGPAASLLIEYNLTRRLIIQAGVARSLKIYTAPAGEYQWPSNWYQKQRPISIDGTCKVLEVPLNLRYDLIRHDKARWFAGAGVSSYKMQNEIYTYNYKYSNDPNIRWWKWEGQTGWYFLSHLNASIGYERRISGRLSLLAEPYVRVPLRRVGFGKVNLFSTGVWLSARYTPVFRK